MAKKKTKEFIMKRDKYSGRSVTLKTIAGRPVKTLWGDLKMCHGTLVRFFGINLKKGEKQRVEISITLK